MKANPVLSQVVVNLECFMKSDGIISTELFLRQELANSSMLKVSLGQAKNIPEILQVFRILHRTAGHWPLASVLAVAPFSLSLSLKRKAEARSKKASVFFL